MVFLYLYSWGSSEHHKIKVVNVCLHATCSFPRGGDSLALAIMIPRKQSQMVTLPISRQQKGLASFIFANLQVYNQAQGVMSLREKGRLIRGSFPNCLSCSHCAHHHSHSRLCARLISSSASNTQSNPEQEN